MGDDAGTFPSRDLRQPRLRLPRRRSGLDVRGRAPRDRARARDRRAPGTARPRRLRPAPRCTSRPTRPTPTSSTRSARSRACSACSAATLHHVKLHGAFSTHVAEDPAVADGVLRAVHDIDPALPLDRARRARSSSARPPRSATRAWRRRFPERGYAPERAARAARHPGRRRSPTCDEAARRAVRMAVEGKVDAIDGTPVSIRPAHALHPRRQPARRGASPPPCGRALEAAGVELAAF